jgi:hypothetical protein
MPELHCRRRIARVLRGPGASPEPARQERQADRLRVRSAANPATANPALADRYLQSDWWASSSIPWAEHRPRH